MKKVLSFGVFDGIHPGHIYFLEHARSHGDELAISLARDEIVLELKGSEPVHPFKERKSELKETELVDEIIKGDYEVGAFRSVTVIQPQMICLGYDQSELKKSLKVWMNKYGILIPVITIKPFKPEQYKSSLLNKKYD